MYPHARLPGGWARAVSVLALSLAAPYSARPVFSAPQPGFVSTVAGYGIRGGSNTDHNFASPGLAHSDDEGGVYFPDTGNHLVYYRDPWNIMAPLAGNGLPGFSGDGGPPSKARLNSPKGVCARGGSRIIDPDANPEIDPNKPVGVIYISDTGNHRVRKIFRGPKGTDVIQTLAGDGTPEYKGDHGPALAAGFVSPEGIAADSAGNVYVADRLDHRVRMIAQDGTISTLAGTGVAGFGGDGGPAANAQLNEPTDLLVDKADNLYISDRGNNRIRIVTPDRKIHTLLGGGLRVDEGALPAEIAVDRPAGMAMDRRGSFYFTDGRRVRVYQGAPPLLNEAEIQYLGGLVTKLRDPANPLSAFLKGHFTPGYAAQLANYDVDGFDDPVFLAATVEELNAILRGPNMYTAERFAGVNLSAETRELASQNLQGEDLLRLNRRLLDEAFPEEILRNVMDGRVYTFAGSGQEGWLWEGAPAAQASFRRPYGLAAPSQERLMITDDLQRKVRIANGRDEITLTTAYGKNLWDDIVARSSRLVLPAAVAPMADGRALIADYGNRRIRAMLSPCSESLPRTPYFLYSVAGKGIPLSANGTTPCTNPNTVAGKYAPTAEGSKAVEAEIGPPTGVAGAVDGTYYFSEGEKGRVWRVDPQGVLHPVHVPGGLLYPMGLAVDTNGRLFIADRDASKVWVNDPRIAAPNDTFVFAGSVPGDGGDGGAATQAKLNAPEAVAVGPDGSVYITDTGNHKVKRVTPDGTITTVAGNGSPGYARTGPALSSLLNTPRGVAADGDGTLYVADSLNHRIVRLAGGAVSTVSGGPEPGQPPSDPLTKEDRDTWAGESAWYEPAGLAFDGAGNLYVADQRNHRIRVIAKAAEARDGLNPAFPYGDANEDGKVDVNDAITVLRIAVELIQPTPSQALRADVAPFNGAGQGSGDGAVNTLDAIRILRRIIGLVPEGEWGLPS